MVEGNHRCHDFRTPTREHMIYRMTCNQYTHKHANESKNPYTCKLEHILHIYIFVFFYLTSTFMHNGKCICIGIG